MKTIHIAIAAASLFAATASQAVEATRFEAPTMSTQSRAEVQAAANRASDAGELQRTENYPRFVSPMDSEVSRAAVQAEATRSAQADSYTYTDPTMTTQQFVGGM